MKTYTQLLKDSIKQFKDELCDAFCQNGNIAHLTRQLVTYVDELILILYFHNKLHLGNHFCLLALGSYGRRELQLHSDIDLLLLHSNDVTEKHLQRAQYFIQDCWDSGLDISHQITTVESCAELASQNLSVMSTILDMHLLTGQQSLMDALRYQTHRIHIWPSTEYFFAKQREQEERYNKYSETAYNLEPNVKYGPGGLRDLQLLLNIGKRHFGIKKLADGINSQFINDKEYEELIHCQHFLWKVRFALHYLAQKNEERLLFDYQVKLAKLFNFEDQPHSLAIEQFMKTYFKVIKRSRELNEMLLQWFSEVIVHHTAKHIVSLDKDFQLSNQYIEVKHRRVFSQNPYALISLFLWIAKKPMIAGISASTIRLIRQHLYLMNKTFLSSEEATSCFLQLFRDGNNPYVALHQMNKHGVLGHYLDAFAAIIGQMQYDLFHVFTVDQHTLFVIRNLVRFKNPEYEKQFSLAAKLMKDINKHDILYLAALFHDIAKGRGGDHSDLGALEALRFANRHHLSKEDSALLIWLVQNHLLMSHTAQRQDIYDPKTITKFCNLLPDSSYLDYLYLLTVADIYATNKKLWNSWKDSLLKELYHATFFALLAQKTQVDEEALVARRKKDALALLKSEDKYKVRALWKNIKNKYFLHEPADVIARHTKALLTCQHYPLVMISPHHSQGGTEVFIYMPHRDERFAISTAIISNHRLTIQEATISTCDNAFDLDTYIILNDQHQAFIDDNETQNLLHALDKALTEVKELPSIHKQRISRAQAHFNVKPNLVFSKDLESSCTRLFLVASDRPGLLAHVSRIFAKLNIHLHNAKISTAGERAEDTFYLSSSQGDYLTKEEEDVLQDLLVKQLS